MYPFAGGGASLAPEDEEELHKILERREKFRQNYLKHRASEKVAEDYELTKAKKKAEMDAKKSALRAEDISKGVFVPVSNLPKSEPTRAALPVAVNQ